jgi:hypothetical protein
MPRPSDPDRLKKLQQSLAATKLEIMAIKTAEKKQERQKDARRKIIAGALALEHAEKNPGSEFAKQLLTLLHHYTRPHERHLFPVLPPQANAPKPSE